MDMVCNMWLAVLSHQQVDVYVSATGENGAPLQGLGPGDLRVLESVDGVAFEERELLSVTEGANQSEGVTFLLLVDNSGSMYDTIAGSSTDDPGATRMAAVKRAIRRFLDRIDNPADRVALATFNTNYTLLTEPTASLRTVDLLLDEIARPTRDEAYTELYRGVSLAAEEFTAQPGRRVVLILSDGENYPYAIHSGEPHPIHGATTVDPSAAIIALRREGVGAFGISFAGGGDPALTNIADAAGGLVFDARDGAELETVYDDIRSRILQEYRLRYRAGIAPAEERVLRVELAGDRGAIRAERAYFAGTIFGLPRDDFGPPMFIPLVTALLVAVILSVLRFQNRRRSPTVEVLSPRGGATQVVDITGGRTVIGASADADLTVAGSADMQDRHATIVKDEARNTYTIESTQPITVNNRQTTKRTLSPGDVIQLPGATVVFDLPDSEGGQSAKR